MKRGAIAAATALLLAFSLGAPGADDRARLDALKKDIGKLQGWLESAKRQQSDLLSALRKTEVEIGTLTREMRDIRARATRARNRLERLENEHATLLNQIRTQEVELHRQIRASYMTGQQQYLKLLLNQTSPDTVLRVTRYYEYFHRARLERIEAYSLSVTALGRTRRELATERSVLESEQGRLDDRRQALESSRRARLMTLTRLSESIRDHDDRLKRKQQDREQLESLLSAVRSNIGDIASPAGHKPFAGMRGKLPWPATGATVHGFMNPAKAGLLHENGVHIRAAEGSNVRAVHHGRVVFADWLRRFGLMVIIDHGGGFMSLYAHNQTLLREAGDWVIAGEPVATVGNSGGQDVSGLYFEIRQDGRPQDPRKWFLATK